MNEIRRFQGTAHYETTRSENASTTACPYLRRNLRRALDSQQYDLLLQRGHDPASEIGGSGDYDDDDDILTSWDFPPATMLNNIIKALEPTIIIDKLALRHSASAKLKPSPQRPRLGRAGSPDWLPTEDEWKVPCQVSVRLIYQHGPKKLVCQLSRKGHILRHGHRDKYPAFEIVLGSPFKIELGKFEVMVDYRDSNGNTKWKLARADDECFMQFRVQCNNSADSADLLGQLEQQQISDYSNSCSEDGELRFTWKGLPDLPTSGRLLDLRRSERRKIKDLTLYKADVNMVWNQECRPLAAWNRACRLQQQEAARQLPTPSVSDDSERPRKMRVQYLTSLSTFSSKYAVNEGLYCVVSSCHGRAEHSSLERLMLHYAIHHDHMKFEINADRSGENLAVILVGRSENESASPSSKSQEFSWEAPRSAFDIAAHLKGTKPWVVTQLRGKEKTLKSTPQKSPRKRTQAGQPDHIPISLGRPKPPTRRPEEVLNLPLAPRTRHSVPEVEHISFYRTLSKQQVSVGDEISDSEAEADTEWAMQGQRREQTLLGIDRVTQDFNELFNKHLDLEQPMSDIFVLHAIVRFARKYSLKLSQERWKEQFRAKLQQFEDKRIINTSTVTYCMGLLTTDPMQPGVENVRETTPSSQGLGGKGRFTRRGRESGTQTPERGRAMSPPNQMSAKSRFRWGGGKILQQEGDAATNVAHRSTFGSPTPGSASQNRHTTPFVRRKVVCRRGSKSIGPHHIYDFIRDDRQDVPQDEIRPIELEFAKFLKVLSHDLALDRDADGIFCSSNGTAGPIIDEDGWRSALDDLQINSTSGDIVFELRPRDLLEISLNENSNPMKRKGVDGSEPPSQKKLRIQQSLCICGHKAEGQRGTMACGNPKCSGKFHLRCLSLPQRPKNEWLCEECC